MTMRKFRTIWEGLIEPAWTGAAKHHLARTFNVILLLLLLWEVVFEIQYRLINGPFGRGEILTLAMIGMLALAYYLNHRSYLGVATVLTLLLFITFTFALALFQHESGSD